MIAYKKFRTHQKQAANLKLEHFLIAEISTNSNIISSNVLLVLGRQQADLRKSLEGYLIVKR